MKKRLQASVLLLFVAWTLSAADYVQQFPPRDKTQVLGIATDRSGNIFVCGSTANAAALGSPIRLGPTQGGTSTADAFVMKLSAAGQRLGTVVFGGGGYDSALRLAVDSAGNVVVIGYTGSRDFPTRNPLRSAPGGDFDGFVCKFDASGTNLLFSTYLGSRSSAFPAAVAFDAQGDILLAGSAFSDDSVLGTNSAPQNFGQSKAFLVKLSSDGSSVKSESSLSASGSIQVAGIAVDAAGNAVLAGSTTALDFPTRNAFQPSKPVLSFESAFVAKFAPDGALVFSTFLGGDTADRASAVAVNDAGEIFVAGSTASETFPASAPVPYPPDLSRPNNSFLVKLDPLGAALLRSNIFRPLPQSEFYAVAVAPDGSAIAGGVAGPNFAPGIPMLAALRPDGSIATHFDPMACGTLGSINELVIDSAGNVIVRGSELRAGRTASTPFVAKYPGGTLPAPAGPAVRIISPVAGERVAHRRALSVSAAVVGATGAVESVSYFDGRRLIGVATNAPFGVVWTNVPYGPHNLRAVARVDGASVASCVVRFTAASPRNDNFARRIRLFGERVVVRGTTTAASAEPNEPGYAQRSVWYSWVAPRDGTFEFNYKSGAQRSPAEEVIYAAVDVFTGSPIESLVPLTQFYDTDGRVVLRIRRGTACQIRVVSFVDDPFLLSIRRVSPPANDGFAKAQDLQGETFSVAATTRFSTIETGEPNTYAGQGSVWFSWTAPASGPVFAAVDGPGAWPLVRVYGAFGWPSTTRACPRMTLSRIGWCSRDKPAGQPKALRGRQASLENCSTGWTPRFGGVGRQPRTASMN